MVIDNSELLLDYLIQNDINLLISVNQPYLNTQKYPQTTWTDINPANYNQIFQLKEVNIKLNNKSNFSFEYAFIPNLSLNDTPMVQNKISSFLLNLFTLKSSIHERIALLCE